MANTYSQVQSLHHYHNNHQHHNQMSSRCPYEMARLGSAQGLACRSLLGKCGEQFMYVFIVTCKCSLSHVSVNCHVYVSVVTCRCSSDDRTAPSTSTATGPTTRKDLATCLANSGLVGERLMLNPFKLV